MGTTAKIGYGIALSHSTTSGGTYTAFAELQDVKPPAFTQEKVKVYRSDNTAAIVEQIRGWAENGDATLSVTYGATTRASIEALKGVDLFFKLILPLYGSQATAGDTFAWQGFVSEVGDETPLKDQMKCGLKFAVSGAVTFTAGS